MSFDTPKGTTPEIRLVSRPTLEKRARRALRKQCNRLIKTRAGTAARRENGLYCVADEHCKIIMKSVDLGSLAKGLGVMSKHEQLMRPANGWDGWFHHIARHRVIEVDGKRAHYNEPLTADYPTAEEAKAAAKAAGLKGDDLVLVGFNTTAGKWMEGDDATL